MSNSIIKKLESLSNKSEYMNYKKITEQINNIDLSHLDGAGLLSKSNELKNRLQQGTSMDDILIDAFALVKESVKRTLSLEAYDEQIIAGIAMHKEKLIEMQTGEGKTLTAVFPAYLNALTGLGCHILTFNDYLARRDAAWMGPIYRMLGLTVGFVQDIMNRQERKKAYSCDVTYVTAKEAGFDYLRDSLCYVKDELVQRPFNYAIVDEADSIIIDEARIPLVIAAGGSKAGNTIYSTMEAVKKLRRNVDYDKDEYEKNVFLTEKGLNKIEAMLGCENLYSEDSINLLNEVHNALYANVLLKKDIHYIVRDEKIEMVDEFTGRIAENRHWPDGVQAALEAKEGLGVKSKGRIMSQVTLHSFILLYKKVAGMTATAMDSAEEIREFYGLDVFVIPPHVPCIRKDYPDEIFTHKEAKYKAIVNEIIKVHELGQPILIGTSSVKESELLAGQLNTEGIHCQILNAKNDELEAGIIEQAGVLGAVTVSTNMAGRGADIKLGGVNEVNRDMVVALGGLYVIGTNRHESMRIDKQLRGRAGRQGDPGMSRFFISLEDDLIKQYGIDKVIPEFIRPKNQEEPLDNPKIARKVAQVQRIVQGQNSDLRRALWKYSFAIESKRLQVYERRMEILKDSEPFNILQKENNELYISLVSLFSEPEIKEIEKQVALYNIDEGWANYLADVAIIQDSINLNVIGGKNPLIEFKMETAALYEELQKYIQDRIIQDFEEIELSEKGLSILRERIKPPSATWTYLVNDNSIIDSLSALMIGSGGIMGAVSIGMLVAGPASFIFINFKKFLENIKQKSRRQ